MNGADNWLMRVWDGVRAKRGSFDFRGMEVKGNAFRVGGNRLNLAELPIYVRIVHIVHAPQILHSREFE